MCALQGENHTDTAPIKFHFIAPYVLSARAGQNSGEQAAKQAAKQGSVEQAGQPPRAFPTRMVLDLAPSPTRSHPRLHYRLLTLCPGAY